MSNDKDNYRNIFKATTFLGGVQIFNIVIGIIRNKIVSMLLGPSGMGIVGLFTSSSQIISGATNCGISGSAVKNVAQAYEQNNNSLIGKVIYVLRRLVAGTGSIAVIVMLVLSRKLSQWSFGNDDFTISFICLSISLLLGQLTQASQTVIKGCRKIHYYAKANVYGNLVSLLVSVPLYYLWGKDAIVLVLVLLSLSTFLFAFFYERRIGLKEYKPNKLEFKEISNDILKMGLPLAVSEIFPILASYLIRLHVSSGGGVFDVGLYTAGFTLLNTYVGMIFTAMVTDYIPRLSAIAEDNVKCEETINNQIQLSILMLFPILVALVVLGKVVVMVLYTKEFLAMAGMLYWGGLGMLYRTLNWCYGCILVPKRDTKPYFLFSVISALFYCGFSVIMYNFWGVTGLGVAFLASHAFDFVVAYAYISKKYNIRLRYSIFIQVAFFSIVILSVLALNLLIHVNAYCYVIEAIVVVLASWYSFRKLNQLMDFSSFIKSKLGRNK